MTTPLIDLETPFPDEEDTTQFWRGPILPLDHVSGDQRMFATPLAGSQFLRPFPMPLSYAKENWGAHQGSVDVGVIDAAWVEDGMLWGEGRFDTSDPNALEVIRKIGDGFHHWVSVDLDKATSVWQCMRDGEIVDCESLTEDEYDDPAIQMVEVHPTWRLSGLTLVSIQAFPEAVIQLVEEPMHTIIAAAVDGTQTITETDDCPTLPLAEWFDNPNISANQPITLTEDGRISGRVATFDTCHVGIKAATGSCVTAPHTKTDYAAFNRIPLETDNGLVPVGRITSGYGAFAQACECCPHSDDHACISLSMNGAMSQHDNMDTLAYVRAGEDEHGIWVAGIVSPGISEKGRAVLARQLVSGDWRTMGNTDTPELIEILALSQEQPGFPVTRARMDGNRRMALVAAAHIPPAAVSPIQTSAPALTVADVQDLVAHTLDERAAATRRQQRAIELSAQMRATRAAIVTEKMGA